MKNHTEVKMLFEQYCDFCKKEGKEVRAEYDGKTKEIMWAWMCDKHFKSHGVGLGLGKGQKLIYK